MFSKKSLRIAIRKSLQDSSEKPAEKEAYQKPPSTRKRHQNSKKSPSKRSAKKKKGQTGMKLEPMENEKSEGGMETSDFEMEKVIDLKRQTEVSTLVNFKEGWMRELPRFKIQNKTLTNYDKIDFGSKEGTCKVSSWSLDGLNKLVAMNGMEFLKREDADVFCLQNLQVSDPAAVKRKLKLDGYLCYFNVGSWLPGIAVFTKFSPVSVQTTTKFEKLDKSHSVMILEFGLFTLVNAIAPSAGFGLEKLEEKLEWHRAFISLVKELKVRTKPLVIAGNFQVAAVENGKDQPLLRCCSLGTSAVIC